MFRRSLSIYSVTSLSRYILRSFHKCTYIVFENYDGTGAAKVQGSIIQSHQYKDVKCQILRLVARGFIKEAYIDIIILLSQFLKV